MPPNAFAGRKRRQTKEQEFFGCTWHNYGSTGPSNLPSEFKCARQSSNCPPVPDAVQRAGPACSIFQDARRGALLIRDRYIIILSLRSRLCSAPLRAEEAHRAALCPGHNHACFAIVISVTAINSPSIKSL